MIEQELIEKDIEAYLARQQKKEILRFLTAGSVDDGKSTLIGRLLHDANMVYEDQLATLHRDSAKKSSAGGEVDYSLLVDGLMSEREQGITIDVAYRYFSTAKRKFIIADTPGHEQYTRNMATGASTANLAIILIDARQGVLAQTRRHTFIASLLGIKHLIVAVNKMDLVGWDERVFKAIREDYFAFAEKLGVKDAHFLPLSALKGDNVVTRSDAMPWYEGPPLLAYLETVPIASDRNLVDLRFPVQYVMRPNLDFRGFSGTLASGVLRRGDRVMALPSGRRSKVRSIVTFNGDLEEASASMAITVTLEDEIDVSRGDMLVREGTSSHAGTQAGPGPSPGLHVGRALEATVVWMSERPLRAGASYLIKHGTKVVTAEVTSLECAIDVNTLERREKSELGLNDIGVITLSASRPLIFDAYSANRATGAFILIDRVTNGTVGAGMVKGPVLDASNDTELGRVTQGERERRLGQKGVTLSIPGGAGVAALLERKLWTLGYTAILVDSETAGLAERARAMNDLGLVVIVARKLDDAERAMIQRVTDIALPTGVTDDAFAAEVAEKLQRNGFVA